MKKERRWVLPMAAFVLMALAGSGDADDARVLPKGVWSAGLEANFYLPITERFDRNGNVESAAKDLNGVFDNNFAPFLNGFKGPPFNVANPNLGRSEVSFRYEVTELKVLLARGLTEKLTIGAKIPYTWARNDVSARIDNSAATIGVNTNFNGAPANGPPFLPLGLPGVRPVTLDDMQGFISGGLVINGIKVPGTGLGFKPVQSWSKEGFGDIEVGLKYQYLSTPSWRLAFTGGVRCPTGDVDDPDDLVDRGFGSGAWTGLFFFQNDYIGIKDLVINGTFRYFLTLPDKQTVRVVDDPHQPLTAREEKIDRDLGDAIEGEGSVSYSFMKGASVSLLYKYARNYKTKAEFNGTRLPGLEAETDATEQVIIAGLSYNTFPLVQEKKFPIPLSVSAYYRNRFAGTNGVLKSEYIGLGLQFFF